MTAKPERYLVLSDDAPRPVLLAKAVMGTRDAAEFLGVSEKYLTELARSSRIAAVRTERSHWRFRTEDLIAFRDAEFARLDNLEHR
jgi:excisionase family DNA binding protein